MADEGANTDPDLDAAIEHLKSVVPEDEHAALDSRLQELVNDPSTDDDDVIDILREEFEP